MVPPKFAKPCGTMAALTYREHGTPTTLVSWALCSVLSIEARLADIHGELSLPSPCLGLGQASLLCPCPNFQYVLQ